MWWIVFGTMGCLTPAAPSVNPAAHGHEHTDEMSPTIQVPDLSDHHTAARPWTSLAVNDDPSRFHFVVVTDRTGGAREGIFPIGLNKINLVQPAFTVSVGDLIEGYTKDRAQIDAEWDQFSGFTAKLDAPFFYVAGNHDMMNTQMAAAWADRFGASYYHFLYKGALFVVANSELMDINPDGPDKTRGPGYDEWYDGEARKASQAKQMAYLEQVLADNQDVRWTFLFIHKPFWRSGWERPPRDDNGEFILDDYPVDGPYPTISAETSDWTRLQAMLADRNYTAFAGHRHSYAYEDVSDGAHTHEHIALATTGGVSRLRGLRFGEFDHFVWVTMTEDGPTIANLTLDGVQPAALKTPDARPWWLE
ncbi:MAG: metallophosphoesterase [Myxococcota bacterium]